MFANGLVALCLLPVVWMGKARLSTDVLSYAYYELIVPPLYVLFWIRATVRGREQSRKARLIFWIVWCSFCVVVMIAAHLIVMSL
jgi:hypothetical protein